jgi:hypothetical protein
MFNVRRNNQHVEPTKTERLSETECPTHVQKVWSFGFDLCSNSEYILQFIRYSPTAMRPVPVE